MSQETILTFHGIGTPPARIDASERRYWVAEAFYAAIIAHVAARPDVRIAFDDGNRSDIEIGAPVLARHGRTGSFFALSGRLDDPGYLAPSDLRALVAMGMQVGLHGRDHVDWRQLDDAALDTETVAARDAIARAASHPVDSVAIPFGSYNRRVLRQLRRCGFAAVYTSDGGHARNGGWVRSRTSVRGDMTMADIDAILADAKPLRAKLRRGLSTFVRRNLV